MRQATAIALIACALSALAASACGSTHSPSRPTVQSPPPLLDGRCDEYAALAAERHRVTSTVDLFVLQDRDYVWLCYTLPPDTFGALDMVLAAPALAEPLNLHVSAQLGEWPAGQPAPADASSSTWWNQRGWSAFPVPFNGTKPDGSIKFRPTPGRELQLGKARFGRGRWTLRMQIYGVDAGGGDAHFPTTGDHMIEVW
jgi:hypothetical protein